MNRDSGYRASMAGMECAGERDTVHYTLGGQSIRLRSGRYMVTAVLAMLAPAFSRGM